MIQRDRETFRVILHENALAKIYSCTSYIYKPIKKGESSVDNIIRINSSFRYLFFLLLNKNLSNVFYFVKERRKVHISDLYLNNIASYIYFFKNEITTGILSFLTSKLSFAFDLLILLIPSYLLFIEK